MKKILLMTLLLAAACSDEVSPTPARTPPPPSTASTSSSAPQPPTIKGPKLMPVDQAWLDASFVTFRSNLLEVVRRRDTKALLAAIDPKIRTSFGPGGGKDDFKWEWLLDQPDSPLWQELELILTHGGTFNAGAPRPQFWAPYVYSAWPESHDSFESLAVIVGRAPLHESNSASSSVLATLSYDIVKLEPKKSPTRERIERETWRRVATAGGRLGWVETRFVRSPIDYRAGFSKSGESWKMDALVAGD